MATEEDKINNGALATLAAVLTFGMFGIYMALTALTRDQVAQEFASKEAPRNKPYEELVAAQRQKLAQGVPIGQAMQNVVNELAQNPASATPPPAVGSGGADAGASGSGAGAAASSASGAGSGGAGSGGAAGAGQSARGGAGGGSGRTATGIPVGEERVKAQQPNRLPQDATAPPPGAIAPNVGVPIAHPEPAVSPK